MDADLVAALTTAQGKAALAAAAEQSDPSSLAAASALRARFSAGLSSAALSQEHLRRRAVPKFGAAANSMLFTPDGLEQASRPEVSSYRAQRLVAAGVRRVVDLGCGIGSDAVAFAAAGLRVSAVERDPATALVAQANLGTKGIVYCGDAEEVAPDLVADPGTAVFCDPARRDAKGRLWQLEQFSPDWSFVLGLLESGRPACVKLGPGLPHSMLPRELEAEWISVHGDVVEVALWAHADSRPGARVATLLPAGERIVRTDAAPEIGVSEPKAYLYEPNGAVIRAGAVTLVGAALDATLLDPQIAYLTSDRLTHTPFATAFAVREALPYQEKALRAWVRDRGIGELEIKKRGIDVDPAELRKRLRPNGANRATLVLSRSPQGARVLVVERVASA
ncbi:class I SAM-dependent methyltransferase [Microlunatus panaciterrae]|uniref:SAM-dependent methyltransferase n=1 Tax=Microlunatus panaciterrae TaxID=400768 RepID=A0ABS2RKU3_9ACTN|nr:SAM-dependent methyltransferase [Microlunatus panaciterrae]